MDLPHAEIRYQGLRAVGPGVIRAWDRFWGWFRPRAAPIGITALATGCMLAGLDLVAKDFRRLRDAPTRQVPMIYVSSLDRPGEVIPVELAPTSPRVSSQHDDVLGDQREPTGVERHGERACRIAR